MAASMQTLQPVVGNAARGERGRAAVRVGASTAPRAHPLPQRRARLVAAAGVSRAAVTAAAVPEEVLKAYQRLQNGSDVRGVALPGVAGQDVTLSPERAGFIAQAFVGWLAGKTGLPASKLRVSVGTDPRLSGPDLMEAIIMGLASAGCSPVRLGLATTPACFMSCITTGYEYDASIMLTASHLPWNRNGMKFFTRNGGLGKKDIAALVESAAAAHDAAKGAPLRMPPGAQPATANFLPVYAAQLVQLIRAGVAHPTHYDTPLAGFKIVVDAGNGSGGFFASQVLAPLGADTRGSQFLDPDGIFPNHVPNPEEAAAVESAAAAVRSSGADLGVIFDTDVDRSAIIDRAGVAINRNRLIALLAAVVLRERPGATIVTDSVTSDGLTAFITAAGGKHYRYRRGYKNVIDKGVELSAAGVDVPLMIETSGHGAMAENHYLDDGAYLAVKVLIEAGRRRLAGQGDVEQLLSTLREPLEEAEFRLPLLGADFKAEGAMVVDAFAAEVHRGGFAGWKGADDNHEGFRACVDEGSGRAGWALLRQSLHDPLLVLNLESEAPGGAAVTAHAMLCWLQAHGGTGVDISALEKAFALNGVWADYQNRECVLHPARSPRLGGGACGDVGAECDVQ